MRHALLLAAVLAVVGVLPAVGDAGPTGGARSSAQYDLEGGVDDDWSIWLVPPGGDNVTTLPPRAYVIDVSDSSKDHNYHLRGPGVDIATSLGREEYTVWTVTLAPGTYEYFSDSEPREIRETFTVSESAPPLPPPQPQPPQPQPPQPQPPQPPPTATRSCRVPRVLGLRLVRARTAIRRANCSVGRVRGVRSRAARGRVVRQSPRAGTRLRRGARIALVISRGRR